jgi:RimJ/RimL family protein N-acetyltransferase
MHAPLPRLRLEPVAEHHAPALQPLAADPEVVARTYLPDPYPPDGALAWIRATNALREQGREDNFAILRPDGRPVGVIGLTNIADGAAELGYWIGRPYWGQGYVKAAAPHVIAHGFRSHGLQRLYATVLATNKASIRVLQRAGFRYEQSQRSDYYKWPGALVYTYGLARAQWAPGAAET